MKLDKSNPENVLLQEKNKITPSNILAENSFLITYTGWVLYLETTKCL